MKLTAEEFLREKLASEISNFGANKVHFDAEMKLKELLEDVMPVSNWSADERLYYIRQQYKDVYDKIKTTY